MKKNILASNNISIYEYEMLVPQNHYNIGIVGNINSGKNTIINTLFGYDFFDIKESPLFPFILVETDKDYHSQSYINEQINIKNNSIKEHHSKKLNFEFNKDIMKFYVKKSKVRINNNYITIIYIPIYKERSYYYFLHYYFNLFDVLIHVIDLNKLIIDQEKITYNWFCEQISSLPNNSIKKIKILTIANKVDMMNIDYKTNNLEIINFEMKEAFGQLQKNINQIFSDYNLKDNLLGIIPFCAKDAYLYRIIQLNGSKSKLDECQILKLGLSLNGKKFLNFSPNQKNEIIKNSLENKNFINDMLKLTGYNLMENLIVKKISKIDNFITWIFEGFLNFELLGGVCTFLLILYIFFIVLLVFVVTTDYILNI